MDGNEHGHDGDHFYYLHYGDDQSYVIDKNKPVPLSCKVLAWAIAIFYWIQLLNNY